MTSIDVPLLHIMKFFGILFEFFHSSHLFSFSNMAYHLVSLEITNLVKCCGEYDDLRGVIPRKNLLL